MPDPLIRRATLDEVLPLRAAVLRAGKPTESARMPGDELGAGVHWGAWIGDDLVACTSLYVATVDGAPTTQLRGAATREEVRGRGIGGALIEAALAAWRADSNAPRPLWCNARIAARTFYEQHGFVATSEPFEIPGIGTHLRMELREERGVDA